MIPPLPYWINNVGIKEFLVGFGIYIMICFGVELYLHIRAKEKQNES